MADTKFELTPLGKIVWEDRYALKDDKGNVLEKDISETFKRVAKAIASKEKDPKKWEKKFTEIMSNRYFCPAGRILAHSGTHYSQLFNCFVLPFENDSLESIMDTAKNMAMIQKFGGGSGFNYSKLRPSGSYIKGVNGHSCGVLGFIHMMSTVSEVIEQGGSRRGASLGLLEVWHPDIWEYISYKNEHNWDTLRSFIDIKDEEKWAYFRYENLYKLQMYNISVGVTDEFFEALKKDTVWPLMWNNIEWELYTVLFRKMNINGTYIDKKFDTVADTDKTALWKVKKKVPFPSAADTFEVVSRRKIKASELWERICYNSWADGCPGLINMSTARKYHNLEYASPIEATNPCGEQLLSSWGSCNLSSIILDSFVDKSGNINYNTLKDTIHTAIRFADDVIDNCEFPILEIKEKALKERRVGLGTMGVHDFLIACKLGYDTEEGRFKVEEILKFIRDEAYRASIELAKEKGPFSLYDKEKYMESQFIKGLPDDIKEQIAQNGIRNPLLLSQAPTGTTGTMLNSSTGCEPWFSLSFQRNTRLGSYEDGCPAYLKWKQEHPNEEKPAYFKTSQEISPENHIKMMLLFSKYIDSAVSKTVNLPNSATVQDVKNAFLMAMTNGAKGVTVFRDGSKEGVLVNKEKPGKEVVQEILQQVDEDHERLTDSRMQPKKRGHRTLGATYRVHMQSHNLYVIVNRNKTGELVEVFTTVGESKRPNAYHTSGVEDSWAEGLGKIISLALRAGVTSDSIIRNLKNIPSDKPVFATVGDCETSELIPSPPHAIARAIEEELKYTYPDQNKIEDFSKKQGACVECGSSNIHWKSPTCYDCLDCSYSGCSS